MIDKNKLAEYEEKIKYFRDKSEYFAKFSYEILQKDFKDASSIIETLISEVSKYNDV